MLATGKPDASSNQINMMLNFGILIGPFILAVVYPHVGSIAGILGAVGAFVCIYTLPTLTFLAQKKTEIDNPELM